MGKYFFFTTSSNHGKVADVILKYSSYNKKEFDTTPKNSFITDLMEEDFSIFDQVKTNGHAKAPEGHGIGITPNKDFIKKFEI